MDEIEPATIIEAPHLRQRKKKHRDPSLREKKRFKKNQSSFSCTDVVIVIFVLMFASFFGVYAPRKLRVPMTDQFLKPLAPIDLTARFSLEFLPKNSSVLQLGYSPLTFSLNMYLKYPRQHVILVPALFVNELERLRWYYQAQYKVLEQSNLSSALPILNFQPTALVASCQGCFCDFYKAFFRNLSHVTEIFLLQDQPDCNYTELYDIFREHRFRPVSPWIHYPPSSIIWSKHHRQRV